MAEERDTPIERQHQRQLPATVFSGPGPSEATNRYGIRTVIGLIIGPRTRTARQRDAIVQCYCHRLRRSVESVESTTACLCSCNYSLTPSTATRFTRTRPQTAGTP
ncbi:hypothetical protein ZHAS_00022277 [Anopheles sinensis]|uniref:Uncharacterized protein n=1 Tax=Anopheles sinensis TaxID=74873 RepID=A0A084WUX5_ANOSI|nr:hypothetical protein ZHAS_00022277 [Anopheles sinensis]